MIIVWTKHAAREVIEANMNPAEIEQNFGKIQEIYPENGKKKGVLKIKDGFCTIIYVEMQHGVKIITCWRSSEWEKKVWKE